MARALDAAMTIIASIVVVEQIRKVVLYEAALHELRRFNLAYREMNRDIMRAAGLASEVTIDPERTVPCDSPSDLT